MMPRITENERALKAFHDYFQMYGLYNAVLAALAAHGYPDEEFLAQFMPYTKKYDELMAKDPKQAFHYRYGEVAEKMRTERRALELVRLRKEQAEKWSPEEHQRTLAEEGEKSRIAAREAYVRDNAQELAALRAETARKNAEAELSAAFDMLNPSTLPVERKHTKRGAS